MFFVITIIEIENGISVNFKLLNKVMKSELDYW